MKHYKPSAGSVSIMTGRKCVSFLFYSFFLYYMSGVLISPPLNVHHLNPDFHIYFCQCPLKISDKCDTSPDSCGTPVLNKAPVAPFPSPRHESNLYQDILSFPDLFHIYTTRLIL